MPNSFILPIVSQPIRFNTFFFFFLPIDFFLVVVFLKPISEFFWCF